MKLLFYVRSSWVRLTAGGMVMLAVAWLNNGQFTGRVAWDSTTAFVAAFLAWFYSCLPEGGSSALSEHDRNLFARFQQSFSEEQRLFLRQQDFGAAFPKAQLEPLRLIAATWQGVDFEFDDKRLNVEFQELLGKMRAFSSKVAVNTQMIGADFAKMSWNHEDEEGSQARLRVLNNGADELVTAVEQFTKNARRRIS